MTDAKTAHEDLHSEQGAIRGDRPGRAKNPVIKVEDLAWLEFEKPDLDAAERFAHDFGFATAAATEAELYLRGALPGSQVRGHPPGRRGPGSSAPAFRASARADLAAAGRRHRPTVAGAARPRRRRRRRAGATRPASRCGWWPTSRSCPGCRGSEPLPLNFGEAVPGQRHPAAAAGAGAGRAARPRGAGDAVVRPGAGLVPGATSA